MNARCFDVEVFQKSLEFKQQKYVNKWLRMCLWSRTPTSCGLQKCIHFYDFRFCTLPIQVVNCFLSKWTDLEWNKTGVNVTLADPLSRDHPEACCATACHIAWFRMRLINAGSHQRSGSDTQSSTGRLAVNPVRNWTDASPFNSRNIKLLSAKWVKLRQLKWQSDLWGWIRLSWKHSFHDGFLCLQKPNLYSEVQL